MKRIPNNRSTWFWHIVRFVIGCCQLGSGSLLFGQTTATAPVITTQPASYVAEYGADASFSVGTTGTEPFSYQWQKNGINLIDYDNVSGSQSGNLRLAGVAGNDVGNYTVIVAYAGGSITSSVATLAINPTTIFQDTLEQGLVNWHSLLGTNGISGTNGLLLSGLQNHTPGGGASLVMTNAAQQSYHNLPVQYACRLTYSFWYYDDGRGDQTSGGELRGYSGPGYAIYKSPGGLRQIIAIGQKNESFPTNNSGTMAAEVLNTNLYQGRILRGTNSGWFNLNATRSAGWHQFTIDRLASGTGEVDFYVDQTLARRVTGVYMAAVDSIFLGSIQNGQTNGTSAVSGGSYFDDVIVQAYPGLFDWQNLATGGPIPDWMQFRETGTNQNVIRAFPSTVFSQYGASTNASLGDWAIEGSAIYSAGIRGYVEYAVSTTADGAYRIEVEGRERNHRMPQVDMPLEVFIDGENLGTLNLEYGQQTNGLLHCITPFIRAGSHTLRLFWDNVDPRRSLLIEGIRLQALVSASTAANGLPTWMVNRLISQNGIDVCPETSMVSPVCVEGRGQYLSMMSLQAGSQGQVLPVPIQHGAGYRWYANVPLSESNGTTVFVSYQNGGLKETNEIIWQPCNLLLATNNFTIRQGDSLLFTAAPSDATNGEVNIAIGPSSFSTDALKPVSQQFNQLGRYSVTGTYVPTGTTGTMVVTVVSTSFETSPIARVYHARYWDCTNLPPQVVLDPDPRLKLVAVSASERAAQTPALPAPGDNEQEFRVYTRSIQPEYILARLGTNGPIIANVAVRGFRWNVAPDTYLRQMSINPDGSQIIETAFVASPLFPSLTVDAQIISSGVTFDDGTINRTLSAQDFDTTGVCRMTFVRPATAKGSTCHTTKLYDNGVMIGWR